MKIYTTLEKQLESSCVAVGCFDGLHIGHRKIIKSMCSYANENNLVSTVFTFPSAPAAIIRGTPKRALLDTEDKMRLLDDMGVDKCFSIDFSSIKNIEAEDYIRDILAGTLKAKAVFCGFNYRFGKCAKGGCDLLEEKCRELGTKTFVTSPVCFGNETVSSSRIRTLIESGEILTANRLLDRCFSFECEVVVGKQNGRTVGIPTINQRLPADFVVPRYGVYASFAFIGGKRYRAITNIGVRPTVSGASLNAETHILEGFNGSLYGERVRTELLYFVRDERKFAGLSELAEQIKKDIEYIEYHGIYGKYL